MNTMTRCLSGAAAVAIHPHRCEVRREPPILSPDRGHSVCGEAGTGGRQGRWRGYTGTLDRVPGPVRTCQLSPRYIESNNSN